MRFVTALVFAATTAAAFAGAQAQAQDQAPIPLNQGSYFSLQGGVNFNAPTTTYNGFAGRDQRAFLKTGYAVSGAGGYKWSNGLRAEAELTYRRNTFKYFDAPTNPYAGRQVSLSLMANAIYEFPTGSRVAPYIGGGVGITMAWLNDLTQLNTGVRAFINTDSSRFAYQGIAGVAIAIAPQWDGLIDVRYRISDGHHFRTVNVAGTFNSRSNYNIRTTTVMAGLRYAF